VLKFLYKKRTKFENICFFILFISIILFLCNLFYRMKIDFWLILHLFITSASVAIIIYKYIQFHKRFDSFAEAHAPEILTTIGIAGCFMGLIAGFIPVAWMSIFDKENSDLFSKIPSIITSITLSFISSAVGIICALFIKFKHKKTRENKLQNKDANNSKSENLIEAIHKLDLSVSKIRQEAFVNEIKIMKQEQNDKLSSIHNVIEDKMNVLTDCFIGFSKHMVENNSKALIDALKEVIKDFNSKLTEQFGENFKELNSAVKDLVVWQKQYKEELVLLKLVQLQTADDLKKSSLSLTDIVTNTQNFTDIAIKFESTIDNLKINLDRSVDSQNSLSESLLSMKNVAPEFSRKIKELVADLDLNMKQIFSNLESHERNLVINLQKNQADLKDLLIESIKMSQQEISTHLKKASDDMADKVKILDAALEVELNKSLESLARRLGSLSEKFATDYSSITNGFENVLKAIEPILKHKIN
jgi:hypothetical protein